LCCPNKIERSLVVAFWYWFLCWFRKLGNNIC